MIWSAPDCTRMVGGKPYGFGAVTLTLVLNRLLQGFSPREHTPWKTTEHDHLTSSVLDCSVSMPSRWIPATCFQRTCSRNPKEKVAHPPSTHRVVVEMWRDLKRSHQRCSACVPSVICLKRCVAEVQKKGVFWWYTHPAHVRFWTAPGF